MDHVLMPTLGFKMQSDTRIAQAIELEVKITDEGIRVKSVSGDECSMVALVTAKPIIPTEMSSPAELKRYVVSDWFDVSSPMDIFGYLAVGQIFDPRPSQSSGTRFACQQCALAWWKYFDHLHETTHKDTYLLFRAEIARTALRAAGTGYSHGLWTVKGEIHTRFHVAGAHLLISDFLRTANPDSIDGAKEFLSSATQLLWDEMPNGNGWFLHDSEEIDSQVQRIQSKWLAKAPHNSLTLNTHIYTLSALLRLAAIAPLGRLERYNDSGYRTLLTVIDAKPADLLYRALLLIRKVALTSSSRRIVSSEAAAKILESVEWNLRKAFPRLIMPDGFISRDLTISLRSEKYMITNVKDLLSLYSLNRDARLLPVLVGGTRYIRTLDLEKLLRKSKFFLEWLDILDSLQHLGLEDTRDEIEYFRAVCVAVTGGEPLDSYVQADVRF